MKLIRGLYNRPNAWPGCVATIGNFDGMHLGHQAILKKLCEQAKQSNLPSLLMIFEPQPKEFFQGGAASARLMTLRDKCLFLQSTDIDYVCCLAFNKQFASLTATQFIQDILLDTLDVQHLFVGKDFRFGHDRQGDIKLLQLFGDHNGFQVQCHETVDDNHGRISSTRVRECLAAGNLQQAQQLLGRPYSIAGRVAHGDKRGRTIGFPTANIALKRRQLPVQGVFAVRVLGLSEGPLQAVANIGCRPTVDGTKDLLEVHIFNFNREIYGAHLEIEMLHKIRDEMKFASFDELKQQINSDCQKAQAFFNAREIKDVV